MKKLIAACILTAVASMPAAAQTTPATVQTPLGRVARIMMTAEQEMALAGSAAPDTIARGAGMYVFGATGYTRKKASTNGFECLVNRDSFLDGYDALKPTCFDAEGVRTIMPVLLRIGELAAAGVRADSIKSEMIRGFASGKYTSPSRPGLSYMLQGDLGWDPATSQPTRKLFPPHLMIYAPGIRQEDLGITEMLADGDARLPMIYTRGPKFGYIVVRVPPKQ